MPQLRLYRTNAARQKAYRLRHGLNKRIKKAKPYFLSASVEDIAKSIEQQELLQPIGVQAIPGMEDGYRLVYGAHRLAAVEMLQQTSIAAYVLPEEWTEEECLLAELQENYSRNDLTGAQRKAYAAEIGRLIQKIALFPNAQNLDLSWWEQMWKASGITEQTLRNWWNAFCNDY